MKPSSFQPKIIGVSMEKMYDDTAYNEFEKLLFYGVNQLLNLVSPISFCDLTEQSQRLLSQKSKEDFYNPTELKQWANRSKATHVLYGSLKPHVLEDGSLQSIYVDIFLFDALQEDHALKTTYCYTQFEGKHPQATVFTPSWSGFQGLLSWLACQLVGTVAPEEAHVIWPKIQQLHLAQNMLQYEKLVMAHYLTGENSAQQKMLILSDLAKADPNLFLAHLELGSLHKRLQNYPKATMALEWAFHHMKKVTNKQKSVTASEIGSCYALSQQPEKALQWWKAAIQEDPEWVGPYMNMAHFCEEQGKLMEAEQYFKKCAEIAPQDIRAYFNLARLYSKQELWDKAIVQYQQQLYLEPSNAWVYSNLAHCYLQKGEIHQAKNCFEKTLRLDPEGEAGKFAAFVISNLEAA